MAISEQQPVIIIGAGVTALTLAHHLLYPDNSPLTRSPSRRILLLASSLPTDPLDTIPPDYASPWAGAHYRPIPATTPQLHTEHAFALHTYKIMLDLARQHPESGVAQFPATEHLEGPIPPAISTLRTGDTYAGPNDAFRVLDPNELAALNTQPTYSTISPVTWACTYKTYCINTPLYLRWLLHRIQSRGARVVKTHIPSLQTAYDLAESLGFPASSTLVDCSGRGILPDPGTNTIIRGQTVLIANNSVSRTITRQCADGTWAFLIPRPGADDGGTIVGGTKESGDCEARPQPETRRELLERAVQLFSDELGCASVDELMVLRDNVGFRPVREGGMRCEIGTVQQGKEKKRRVVFGYGAGGRGYELSWGVAAKLATLIEEAQRTNAVDEGYGARL